MNDVERAIVTAILLYGVMTFSYMMGVFTEILEDYKLLNATLDNGEKLSQFFVLLKKMNYNQDIDIETIRDMENYFIYRWDNDRNQAVRNLEDLNFLNQLPEKVRNRLYTDFLFGNFLKEFE